MPTTLNARVSAAVLFVVCAVHSGFSGSFKGYDAIGYLTYTAWDASGIPRGKNVMLFVVKIKGDKWLIHTEPVNETKGAISYFEGGGATDSVFMVSVCQGAPVPAEPRLRALRAELQLTRKDDVYFQNRPLPMPAALSNLLHHSGSGGNSTDAKIVQNNAVARALEGKYPAVDASCVAFLWFAFTPPSPEARGEDRMLLQTWDDRASGGTSLSSRDLETVLRAATPCFLGALPVGRDGTPSEWPLDRNRHLRCLTTSKGCRSLRGECHNKSRGRGPSTPIRFEALRYLASPK